MKRSIAALFMLSIWPAICNAQEENAISVPNIRYSDDDAREFYVGDLAEFQVSGRQLQAAGGIYGLRARLFHGTKQQLVDRARHLRNGCLIYRTKISPVRGTLRGFAIRSKNRDSLIFTQSWLKRDGFSRGDEQWYVVVLERGAAHANMREILKLHPRDARGYFAQGFQFVVRSQRALSRSEEEMLAELNRKEQEENRRHFGVARHVECHGYRQVVLDVMGLLAPCDCEKLGPDPAVAWKEEEQYGAPRHASSLSGRYNERALLAITPLL